MTLSEDRQSEEILQRHCLAVLFWKNKAALESIVTFAESGVCVQQGKRGGCSMQHRVGKKKFLPYLELFTVSG